MEENNVFQCDENIETIMDVDSYEDHDALLYNGYDNMSETSSQYDLSQYSLDDESLMIVEDDENSSSSNSSNEGLEIRKRLNESTSIKIPEQNKTKDNDEFEISDQQVPITKIGSTVINSSKNVNLSTQQNKTNTLNLEKIAIPKIDSSNVKVNPPIITNQVKKRPSISVVSTTSLMKPTSIVKLQPKSSITEIGYNKSFSKPKTSNESEVYVVPNNSMNFMIKRGESKNKSLNSNSSLSSNVKTLNSVTKSVEQSKNIIVTTSSITQSGNANKISKFVARMQKLPDGKYKMVPAQGKVPVGLENLFKRNSHFVKQKMESNSMANEHKIDDFIQIESSSMNSRQLINSNKIKYLQKNPQVLSSKSTWNKMSKSIDFDDLNRDKNRIPHTITSKDTTENHTNIIIENGEVKVKTNGKKEMVCPSSGFIKMPPKSESLIQSDGQLLGVNRYSNYKLLFF